MAKFEIFVGHKEWIQVNTGDFARIAHSFPEDATSHVIVERALDRDGYIFTGDASQEFISNLLAFAQGHPIPHGG